MIAEYVSIAHPDRMADLLAAKLITYLQKDPSVHAAIEVMAVNKTVIFAGESNVKVSNKLLRKVVKEVFEDCGYERKNIKAKNPLLEYTVDLATRDFETPGYNETYFKDNVDYVSSKRIKIKNLINKQSEDIAKSTTDKAEKSGWNDQGIFFASGDLTTPTNQNVTKWMANSFGEYLFKQAKLDKYLGTDIKVLIESVDTFVQRLVVAIPSALDNGFSSQHARIKVIDFFQEWIDLVNKVYGIKIAYSSDPDFIQVNTSGVFRKHGMIADTGLTGRKLAVNCLDQDYKNGGGSMIKPWHSADLLIPLYLRDLSVTKYNFKPLMATCSIGTNMINIFDSETEEILEIKEVEPLEIAKAYNLFDGESYYNLVKENFVGDF